MRTIIAAAAAILLLAPVVGADAIIEGPDAGALVDATPDPERLGAPWATAAVTTPLAAPHAGLLLLEGTATAGKGYDLKKIEVHVDGAPLGVADGLEQWSFPLDTTRLVDGPHKLQVYAFGAPKLATHAARIGTSTPATLVTENGLAPAVLFAQEIQLSGPHQQTWSYRLDRDHTGLRVTLEATPATPESTLTGQVLATFHQASAEPKAGPRAWLVTAGVTGAATHQALGPPGGVFAAPGVLTLSGAFAGSGTLVLRVEAMPG